MSATFFKLLGLIVKAAHQTLALVLGNGEISKHIKPASITLIQTHGDELNWNCHLHMIVADGAFNIQNKEDIRFLPCEAWNFIKMAEIFRFVLVDFMHKKNVLSDDVATNMMSWPHSGFHVHASDPFLPSDTTQLLHRLAYAYRTPVALSQISYSKDTVTLRTKKGTLLQFSPLDFIAKLTLHIPNTFQHMRRMAGLYASKTRLFLGLKTCAQAKINTDRKLCISWASLISRIFGEIPTLCPQCHSEMKLLGSLFDGKLIAKLIPDLARAPPMMTFETFFNRHAGKPFLQAVEDCATYDQTSQVSDADFIQRHPDEN